MLIDTISAEVRRKVEAASERWNLQLTKGEVEEFGGKSDSINVGSLDTTVERKMETTDNYSTTI